MDDFKPHNKSNDKLQSKNISKREHAKKNMDEKQKNKYSISKKIENIKTQESQNIMKLNLQYFSNLNGLPPELQDQYKRTHSMKSSSKGLTTENHNGYYTSEDYSIYRKEAFEITKNMFYSKKKHEYNEDIIQSFDIFMGKVIEFLKTKEYSEYYQEDYNSLNEDLSYENKESNNQTSLEKHHTYFVDQELKENNMLMMKHLNPETQSLDKMIHIKKTKIFKPKTNHGFPQRREIPKRENPKKHKKKVKDNNEKKQKFNKNKNL